MKQHVKLASGSSSKTTSNLETKMAAQPKVISKSNIVFLSPKDYPTTRNVSTSPTVMIAANGQLRFNSKASEILLSGHRGQPADIRLALGQDKNDSRMIYIRAAHPGEESFNANYQLKAKSVYFSIAAILRALGYDYAESGSQIFPLHTGEDPTMLVFPNFPEGKLTPRVLTPRKHKAKPEAEAAEVPSEPEMVNT